MPDIRLATADDLADLIRLNAVVQAWHARTYPDIFKSAPGNMDGLFAEALNDADCRIWLSCTGARPGGYLFGRFLARGETAYAHARKSLMIEHIAVEDDARRQGHGAALIEAARAGARRAGCDDLVLESWAENTDAHGFFRAMGLLPQRLRFAQSL